MSQDEAISTINMKIAFQQFQCSGINNISLATHMWAQ